jgi:hypothetical protein
MRRAAGPARRRISWRRWGTAAALVPLILVSVNSAFGGETAAVSPSRPASSLNVAVEHGRIDQSSVSRLEAGDSVDVIVNFRGEGIRATTVQEVNRHHGGIRSKSGRRAYAEIAARAYGRMKHDVLARVGHGVRVIEDYGTLAVQYLHVPSEAAMIALLADPAVASVHENTANQATLKESLPLVHQPEVAALGDVGDGTAVAVLDTGVDYTNAAFGSCKSPGGTCIVAFAQDFAKDDKKRDADGHGTNVAGIVHGMAPHTKILALDVFAGSVAQDNDISQAIDWVVAHQADYNISAMNLSLGASRTYWNQECTGSSLAQSFADAAAVGVIPVVSSGNDAFQDGAYKSGVAYPACTPGDVRVGAVYDSDVGSRSWGRRALHNVCTDSTTAADKFTCFSQGGPLVGIVAPGAIIIAAGKTESGTSQAAPHVAGAIAVLYAAFAGASNSDIVSALANSGPEYIDPREGDAPPGGFHIVRRLDLLDAVNTLRDLLHSRHVIGNGTVQLGVNELGDLNAPDGTGSIVGLRFVPTGADALAPGCLCEGWGVGDPATGVSGYANESVGISNVNVTSYTTTGATAVSVVQVGSILEITHDYHPSATSDLYEVTVNVHNISPDNIADLRYRRVMDWDVPPTEFSEYVTLHTAGEPSVVDVSDDGFATADPLAPPTSILATGDVVDSGPADHGAQFDLSLGSLPAGGTRTFTLYFGATETEADALAALAAVGANVYSLGQPSTADGPTIGTPNTFIFGYKP